MNCLPHSLALAPNPSSNLIDFEALIGIHQQHLGTPRRKAIARLQALVQHFSFFVCEFSYI